MRSLILCEGFDDAYFLSYFLHKTLEYSPCNWKKFAKKYKLMEKESPNQGIEYYQQKTDLAPLAIWSVGGKNSLKNAFSAILDTAMMNCNERIEQLFIFLDKDEETVEQKLMALKSELDLCEIHVISLENNEDSTFSYEVEGENYQLKIIPIIIPFEEKGALETILMEAISENKEGSFVVDEAKKYVENLLQSGNMKEWLQKERLILKAKYSSVIAITNPDRSTAVFDKLLMAHDWEQKESISDIYLH